jgi:hypothetical protein
MLKNTHHRTLHSIVLSMMLMGLNGCSEGSNLDANIEKCVAANVKAENDTYQIELIKYEKGKANLSEIRELPPLALGVPRKMADGQTFTPTGRVYLPEPVEPEKKPDSVIEATSRIACLKAAGSK